MEPQYTMVRKLINPYSIFVVADYYGFDAACTVLFSSLAILMFFLPVVNEFIWFTAADLPDITIGLVTTGAYELIACQLTKVADLSDQVMDTGLLSQVPIRTWMCAVTTRHTWICPAPLAMSFVPPLQPPVYYAGHDPLLYANIVK
ncbi:hypothetical protein L1987_11349 [Smallanthus sonchifolius]|uniref:Uncharacterized protein n=1 Tax=Smallanthus sonchifolius TaxID=185202 RepID=A0ACB9JAQ2_9ASTR|nr:hypothetical protein L1987_11349 [Smallanthus sonchifolius]